MAQRSVWHAGALSHASCPATTGLQPCHTLRAGKRLLQNQTRSPHCFLLTVVFKAVSNRTVKHRFQPSPSPNAEGQQRNSGFILGRLFFPAIDSFTNTSRKACNSASRAKERSLFPTGFLGWQCNLQPSKEVFVLHRELQVFAQHLGLPGLLERRRREGPSAYRNSQALNTYLALRKLLKGSKEYRTNKDRNIRPGSGEGENKGGFKHSET